MTKTEEIRLLTLEALSPIWVLPTTHELSDWLKHWASSVGISAIIPIPEWPEYEFINAPWRQRSNDHGNATNR